jgi:hypothetical protein
MFEHIIGMFERGVALSQAIRADLVNQMVNKTDYYGQ